MTGLRNDQVCNEKQTNANNNYNTQEGCVITCAKAVDRKAEGFVMCARKGSTRSQSQPDRLGRAVMAFASGHASALITNELTEFNHSLQELLIDTVRFEILRLQTVLPDFDFEFIQSPKQFQHF